MKQRKKKKQKAPRAHHLHNVLMGKVCEAHEPKHGHKSKRSKQKQQFRKELLDVA